MVRSPGARRPGGRLPAGLNRQGSPVRPRMVCSTPPPLPTIRPPTGRPGPGGDAVRRYMRGGGRKMRAEEVRDLLGVELFELILAQGLEQYDEAGAYWS